MYLDDLRLALFYEPLLLISLVPRPPSIGLNNYMLI